MMDTKELTRIQNDLQEQLLPDLCNILEKTSVSDGQGGFTETWGTVATNIECLFEPYGGKGRNDIGFERNAAGKLQPFSTWSLSLPIDTDISKLNRVEVNGGTFNVTAENIGMSWGACIMVTLEKV